MSDVDEVGLARYCPACARPLIYSGYGIDIDDFENQICSCCERPWEGCPCSPAELGPCTAVISELTT